MKLTVRNIEKLNGETVKMFKSYITITRCNEFDNEYKFSLKAGEDGNSTRIIILEREPHHTTNDGTDFYMLRDVWRNFESITKDVISDIEEFKLKLAEVSCKRDSINQNQQSNGNCI